MTWAAWGHRRRAHAARVRKRAWARVACPRSLVVPLQVVPAPALQYLDADVVQGAGPTRRVKSHRRWSGLAALLAVLAVVIMAVVLAGSASTAVAVPATCGATKNQPKAKAQNAANNAKTGKTRSAPKGSKGARTGANGVNRAPGKQSPKAAQAAK